MKTKILVFSLSLLLIGPAIAQDKVIREGYLSKKVIEGTEIETDPFMSIQVSKYDKPGAVLTSALATSDEEVDDPLDIINWIDYSEADDLFFYVNFTAMWKTKVRFYYFITGPEFFTYTTDWYNAKYKYNSLVWVYGDKSAFFTKKGTYTLVVVAEQKTARGGPKCVAGCTFRVY